MAGGKRISRKELKEPDELLTVADRAIRYIINNRIKAISMAVVLAVAVMVSLGTRYYFSWQRAKASTALEAALDKLRAAPDGGAELNKAKEMLGEVTTKYSGYRSADYANYYLGNIYYKEKAYDKAIESYRKVLNKAGVSKEALYEMARLGIGYSYEASGDCKGAIDYFTRLTAADGTLFKDQAYLSLGRCYEATGAYQKAHDAYKYVVDNYPAIAGTLGLKDKLGRLQDKLKAK